MTREEWKQGAIFLKTVYPRSDFLNSEAAVNIWYSMLEDLDGTLVEESIKKYAMTSQFPPTVADIRKGCENILDKEARLRGEMREIFMFAKGVYPASRVEKHTMDYWNKLTAGATWEERVEKSKVLRTEIATFVRDAEINGEINEIPTFNDYLRRLAEDD